MFTLFTIYPIDEADRKYFDNYFEALKAFNHQVKLVRNYNLDILVVLSDEDGDWIHTSGGYGEWD